MGAPLRSSAYQARLDVYLYIGGHRGSCVLLLDDSYGFFLSWVELVYLHRCEFWVGVLGCLDFVRNGLLDGRSAGRLWKGVILWFNKGRELVVFFFWT